jgi:peptidylprolyl isomerase
LVRLRYVGWTKDGAPFDLAHDKPFTAPLFKLAPAWAEGVTQMVEGETRRLWIPAPLAYGPNEAPEGAPKGDIVLDVELLDVFETPEIPPPPVDVAAPPANARRTASGIAYRVIEAARDTKAAAPGPESVVTVNYTAWTPDGSLVDSSLLGGQPVSYRLAKTPPGWTEAMQQMKTGAKMRFWIPANLAIDVPKQPVATVVYDVELLYMYSPRKARSAIAAPASSAKGKRGTP